MGSTRRNVVLTGFMGTGKTTVGRVLADRLGYEFVDTDAVIEARHGPIPDIFAEHGEQAFRAMEHDVARELGERDGLVVATGGRLMLDPANAEALGRTGDVFCLTADVDEIVRRLVDDDGPTDRPLLAVDDPRARIAELLAERAEGYARFEQIPTADRSPTDIATSIQSRVLPGDPAESAG